MPCLYNGFVTCDSFIECLERRLESSCGCSGVHALGMGGTVPYSLKFLLVARARSRRSWRSLFFGCIDSQLLPTWSRLAYRRPGYGDPANQQEHIMEATICGMPPHWVCWLSCASGIGCRRGACWLRGVP